MTRPIRFILLALGMTILMAGMWGGLLRLGVTLPPWLALSVPHHGALMIGGFLGTLITLERAVALGRWWCYLGPAAAGLGAWAMMLDAPAHVGPGLITAASVILMADFAVILRRQLTAFTVVMALGGLVWLVGNVLWLAGWAVPYLVPWWAGFLILTIVGERLELSRFMPQRPGRQASFILATGIYTLGLVLGLAWPGLGAAVMGAGLVALAVWLGIFDVARRTIRQRELPRFVAAALLSGYGWLALGGVLMVYYAMVTPGGHASWAMTVPLVGWQYDAIWHCILMGFVFAMIFGHAPIIFPAVLGIQIRYSPLFYTHLALLQVTLAMRVVGDLALWPLWREWGGIGNAAAVLLFLALTVSHARGRPAAGPPASPAAGDGTGKLPGSEPSLVSLGRGG